MPIEAVTFDFHNTLARCDAWFTLEVRELVPETLCLLAARGLAPDDAALRDRARAAYRELRVGIQESGVERDATACALATLDLVGVVVPREAVVAAVDELMRGTLDEVAPLPGAIGAVRELRRRGIRCGVVSNAIYPPFLDWTLDRFGLGDAFAAVVTSAGTGCYKSQPAIYQEAVRRLGATAAGTVHVGDSYRFDVQGARRAGIRAVWYASTLDAMAQPDNQAAATVADLATLPAVVAALG